MESEPISPKSMGPIRPSGKRKMFPPWRSPWKWPSWRKARTRTLSPRSRRGRTSSRRSPMAEASPKGMPSSRTITSRASLDSSPNTLGTWKSPSSSCFSRTLRNLSALRALDV